MARHSAIASSSSPPARSPGGPSTRLGPSLTHRPKVPRAGLGGKRIGTATGRVSAPRIVDAGLGPAFTVGAVAALASGGASRRKRPGHPGALRNLDLYPCPDVPDVAATPLGPRKHYDHRCPRGKSNVSHLAGADHCDPSSLLGCEGDGVARVEPGFPPPFALAPSAAVTVPLDVQRLLIITAGASPRHGAPSRPLIGWPVVAILAFVTVERGGNGCSRSRVPVPCRPAPRPPCLPR